MHCVDQLSCRGWVGGKRRGGDGVMEWIYVKGGGDGEMCGLSRRMERFDREGGWTLG